MVCSPRVEPKSSLLNEASRTSAKKINVDLHSRNTYRRGRSFVSPTSSIASPKSQLPVMGVRKTFTTDVIVFSPNKKSEELDL